MALYRMFRYSIRAEAAADAEHALRAYADYVRAELPATSWTAYRDPVAAQVIAVARSDDAAADARRRDAPGTRQLEAALAPLLAAPAATTELELLTSSDLAPRFRPTRGPARAAAQRRRR